jgi:hypothetical protein
MIDDCGNAVTSGVTGGLASNGDPQLQLRSLLDGRWRVTWNPVSQNPFVNLSVTGADPVNGIQPGIPATALVSIQSAPTAPVLAKGQPFETQAGVRLLALAPNMQFNINGQNFLNSDGTAPKVAIGGYPLQVVSATGGLLVVQTPANIPVDVQMQLVIQRADNATSVPAPVIVAASWPVLAAPPSGRVVVITGLGTSLMPPIEVEGILVKSARRVSNGLLRIELERPLPSLPKSRLRLRE